MNPIIKSELLLLFVPGAEDIQERRHVTCPGVTCDKMLACDAVTLWRDVTALYNAEHDNTVEGRAFVTEKLADINKEES